MRKRSWETYKAYRDLYADIVGRETADALKTVAELRSGDTTPRMLEMLDAAEKSISRRGKSR